MRLRTPQMDRPDVKAIPNEPNGTVATIHNKASHQLPHSDEAERAVLGSMLMSKASIDTAAELVAPDMFYRPAHANIWAAIVDIWAGTMPVDSVLVAERLNRAGLLEAVGGAQYIVALQSDAPAQALSGRIDQYCAVVADNARRRHLITTATLAIDAARHSLDIGETITTLIDTLGEESAAATGGSDRDLRSMLIDWEEFWTEDHKAEEWLAWPILPAGRQVALYAPPKTGKSILTLAVVAALAAGRPILGAPAADPVHVLYLDYEMTRADLYERLESLGYGPPGTPDSPWQHLHYASLPSLPPLNTAEGARRVARLVELTNSRAVVVDTTGRAVDGDENDAGPYREFARHTGLALKRLGVALLRTDHAGKDKDKGQRGSSAKNDDVDAVLRLDLAEDGYNLVRTHSRVPWVPERVLVARNTNGDGLTEFTAARDQKGWPEGTKACAADLDELFIPQDATVRTAMIMLREANKGRRNKVVSAALAYRRTLPETAF